jgi:hypothetical protein
MRIPKPLLFLAPLLVLGGGCTTAEDDAGPTFVLKNTPDGVAASTPLLADGFLLAYLASEGSSGGTDLNGDGDKIDAIAIRVNTSSGSRHQLGVACKAMAFLNRTLFLVVSESADGKDWNGDTDSVDTVLLYVESAATTPTFYAELDGSHATAMAVVGARLLFATATAPVAEFETNLMSTRVSSAGAAPDAAAAVTSTILDSDSDGVSLALWKVADGMAFLTMDETVDGDLNGDADALDTAVLALIDGDAAAQVTTTGLAVDTAGPVEALADSGDWTVAFLVDETDQGVNLNDPKLKELDPAWQHPNCVAVPDADLDDQVLHWCLYSDLLATGKVVNTGLVGGGDPTEFVYIMKSGAQTFVACVSRESDEGTGPGCDLNGDLDQGDRVFRWVDATDPSAAALPVNDDAKLHAVADAVPGFNGDSTGGVVALDPLWVILVDEAADGRDHDGDPADNRLIAALVPALVGENWNFDHGSSDAGPVSVTWMARNARTRTSFVAALSEASLGSDLNGDGDQADSVPTFPERFSGNTLSFPGVGIACDADDAGIVSGAGVGFFRLSEAEDGNNDYNDDGDTNDFLLARLHMSTGDSPALMGGLNTLSVPAVSLAESGAPKFGALLFQEDQNGATGHDLNGDGDANDFVVRYFRFP